MDRCHTSIGERGAEIRDSDWWERWEIVKRRLDFVM